MRALWGEVRPPLRGVAVEWNSHSLEILCYFDGEISADDRQSMECVLTEVIADFPEERDRIRLDCMRKDAPSAVATLGSWVYRRHEPILSPPIGSNGG